MVSQLEEILDVKIDFDQEEIEKSISLLDDYIKERNEKENNRNFLFKICTIHFNGLCPVAEKIKNDFEKLLKAMTKNTLYAKINYDGYGKTLFIEYELWNGKVEDYEAVITETGVYTNVEKDTIKVWTVDLFESENIEDTLMYIKNGIKFESVSFLLTSKYKGRKL